MKTETRSKNWIRDLRLLIKLNIIFYLTIVLIIFFEGDILRIFTPFVLPFLCFTLPLILLVLLIISIIHILPQTEDIMWKSYIPLEINLLTLVTTMFLYQPLGDLRINIGFLIQEKRFNEAVDWVIQTIPSNHQDSDEVYWNIVLPQKYKSLADNSKVDVKYQHGTVIIQFYRGGGMFEYVPSFVYRSDNIAPPFESFAETVCVKRLSVNWYDCY